MTGPEDPDWGWEFWCERFVFARLAEEQQNALKLPPDERARELIRWSGVSFAAAEHCIYVKETDGHVQSGGRCYTCPRVHGVPCVTMCRLARIWADHADYDHAWNEHLEDTRGTLVTSTWGLVAYGGFWGSLVDMEKRQRREVRP